MTNLDPVDCPVCGFTRGGVNDNLCACQYADEKLHARIAELEREKAEAVSDLVCAHREIERHKQEIVRLDVAVTKAQRERDVYWDEVVRMRPVYEAAKRLAVACSDETETATRAVIDAVLAAEKESNRGE